MQISIERIQTKIGTGTSTNSSLEEQIVGMHATMTSVLSNHTSRISQLEYDSGSAEDIIANHTFRIADIETNRKTDIATIQAHTALILGLEQAINDTTAILEKYNDTLNALGKGFVINQFWN